MTIRNITLQNATYYDVPAVELPKDGGGTATFTEITDTTATASDVLQGSYFYTSAGVKTLGTLAQSSGLEYETGTWSPTSDTDGNTENLITFSNAHTEIPSLVAMFDTTGTYDSTTNTLYGFLVTDYQLLIGETFNTYYSSSATRNAARIVIYRSGTNATTALTNQIQYGSENSSASSESYYRYFVSTSGFRPYGGSTSRLWRNTRSYEWIAIWK